MKPYDCDTPSHPAASPHILSHLLAGDSNGNIRVWDLTAGTCSCELVPEVGTAVRSLTVALDGSMVRPIPCVPGLQAFP